MAVSDEDKGRPASGEDTQQRVEPPPETGDSRIELGEVRKGINVAPKVSVDPSDAPPSPLKPAVSAEPAAATGEPAAATGEPASAGDAGSGSGGDGASGGE